MEPAAPIDDFGRRSTSREMDSHLLLLGRTPLADLLQYLQTACPADTERDRERTALEWRRAAERMRELETQEAGLAESPPMAPLSGEAAEFAESQVQTPAAQRTLCLTPHRWCMVDSDRLLVYQKVINLTFAGRISSALGSVASADDLVRVALGPEGRLPRLSIRQTGDMAFAFSCLSNDLRTLGVSALTPQQISDLQCAGRPAGALAIFVGFGINCINALRFLNRLILINGMHRVYALRCRGIRHVPCLVQDISHDGELAAVAPGEACRRIEHYSRLRRPPLFKDYFDERLTKRIFAPQTYSMVHIQVSVHSMTAAMPCAGEDDR